MPAAALLSAAAAARATLLCPSPAAPCWPDASAVAAFSASLTRPLLTPGDAAYAAAVNAKGNPRMQGHPALVAEVGGEADVVRCVEFARRWGIRPVVFASGHSVAGRSSGGDGSWPGGGNGSLAVSVARLASARASAGGRTLTVGAGIQYGDVHKAASAAGGYVAGAQSLTVTPSGFIQGGGHSAVSPSLGLGADSPVSCRAVLANASAVTVSAAGVAGDGWATGDASLWWALRGGGGGTWAVVVSWELELHPEPPGGFVQLQMGYPIAFGPDTSPGREVLDMVWRWQRSAPREWGGGVTLLGVTNNQGTPQCVNETTRGMLRIDFLYNGGYDDAVATAGELLNFRPEWRNEALLLKNFSHYADFAEQDFAPPVGVSNYNGNILLQDWSAGLGNLSSTLVDVTLSTCDIPPGSQVICIGALLGGRVRDVTPSATAMAPHWRTATTHMNCVTSWYTPTAAAANLANIKRQLPKLYTLGRGSYVNEDNLDRVDYEEAYWGPHVGRLREVKRRYDPDDFFSCKQCIKPAAP